MPSLLSFARFAPCAAALGLIWLAGPAVAHDDEGGGKSADFEHRYEGSGLTGGPIDAQSAGFQASGVNLMSWLPLGDFDAHFNRSASSGNDIWGYVSPSGQEYAILGTDVGTAYVNITNPAQPQVVGAINGRGSPWRDVKVYGEHAYVVTENSQGGIQVVDLSGIDGGNVSLVRVHGTGNTHNVAIDETSGFLYRTGSSLGGGLAIFDLNANPTAPPMVGNLTNRYVHDAHVVTYESGIYAGRQIAFAFAEDTGSGGNPALDIYDVTDKSSIQLLSRLRYSNGRFSHQGWLSPDGRYVYLNDESDERSGAVSTTTTRIIDVSDLSNPVEVGTFTNGQRSIDHNLFVRETLIFEANYRSGLRVFDATDPLAPHEIAFFDTFPANNGIGFNGLWGNYPFFPSGTVIGSDIERGLFVFEVPALNALINAGSGGGSSLVPEPSTAWLCLLGCGWLARQARRRRSRPAVASDRL